MRRRNAVEAAAAVAVLVVLALLWRSHVLLLAGPAADRPSPQPAERELVADIAVLEAQLAGKKRQLGELRLHREPVAALAGEEDGGGDDEGSDEGVGKLREYVEGVVGVKPGGTVIFTAVTRAFMPALLNWLTFLYRLDRRNVFVFCLDDEGYAWLGEHGFEAWPHNGLSVRATHATFMGRDKNVRRKHVWWQRTHMILRLLELGYGVVHCDTDALWLQDPLYEVAAFPNDIDIIFSRGNARAGKKGRGTGVCMGFVVYRASRGAVAFVAKLVERMQAVNDVDQGIANTLVGGSRGKHRDKDPYNPEPWYGQYEGTKWVQVPQTRYARHAGAGLARVREHVDLHVFHPTDEGWTLPYKYLPRVLPESLHAAPSNTSASVKDICRSGHWFERLGFSERDIRIFKCCGLWLLKDEWESVGHTAGEPFARWLARASHLDAAIVYKRATQKKAFLEP